MWGMTCPEIAVPSMSPASHPRRPRLSSASVRFTHAASVLDEYGQERPVEMPAERDLTLYLDKRELVTLMTMGAHPELLALGYLKNQRLVPGIDQVESVQVDWDVNACAITTRGGVPDIEERTSRRIVTTGCGQGTVFGGLMDEIENITLGDTRITQRTLYGLLDAMRRHETIYKSAGSVHGCALFCAWDRRSLSKHSPLLLSLVSG